MSDSSPAFPVDPAADGGFEALLVRALEQLDLGGTAAVEALLAANPALAPRVRVHLERLRRVGLTGGGADA